MRRLDALRHPDHDNDPVRPIATQLRAGTASPEIVTAAERSRREWEAVREQVSSYKGEAPAEPVTH